MELYRIMGIVTEQLAWELERGIVDRIDIDYIEETAEKQLTEEELDIFCEHKAAVTIYQDVVF